MCPVPTCVRIGRHEDKPKLANWANSNVLDDPGTVHACLLQPPVSRHSPPLGATKQANCASCVGTPTFLLGHCQGALCPFELRLR
jgi:hypothetical protein